MSNVKFINICGEMTFNATPFCPVGSRYELIETPNKRVRDWLADLNLPTTGLKIQWDHHSLRMVANCHGGKTAMYEYRIYGREAVSGDALVAFVQALQEVGQVFKAWAQDVEAGGPPINLLTAGSLVE